MVAVTRVSMRLRSYVVVLVGCNESRLIWTRAGAQPRHRFSAPGGSGRTLPDTIERRFEFRRTCAEPPGHSSEASRRQCVRSWREQPPVTSSPFSGLTPLDARTASFHRRPGAQDFLKVYQTHDQEVAIGDDRDASPCASIIRRRAASSAHSFLHELADPCMVGGGQVRQSEGAAWPPLDERRSTKPAGPGASRCRS